MLKRMHFVYLCGARVCFCVLIALVYRYRRQNRTMNRPDTYVGRNIPAGDATRRPTYRRRRFFVALADRSDSVAAGQVGHREQRPHFMWRPQNSRASRSRAWSEATPFSAVQPRHRIRRHLRFVRTLDFIVGATGGPLNDVYDRRAPQFYRRASVKHVTRSSRRRPVNIVALRSLSLSLFTSHFLPSACNLFAVGLCGGGVPFFISYWMSARSDR